MKPAWRPPSPGRLQSTAALLLVLLSNAFAASAQEIHLTGLAGERLSDADLAQGTTIVVVWASWSPRSHDIVERMQPLAGRWRAQAKIMTVDFEEDRKVVEAFLAGKTLGLPVFLDTEGAFSKKYAVATLPGLLVVKEGKTLYHGKLPEDPDRLLATLIH
jgi:thiol-disulfide isomerase/thioredoxin